MSGDIALLETNVRDPIRAMSFSITGEYLVSGSDNGVRVQRVANREEVVTMTAHNVRSLAVSDDGKWVAAGTGLGRTIVWNALTYKTMFSHKENGSVIRAVDFSPDSSRLVAASSNSTISVWDVTVSSFVRVLGPLHHRNGVIAARYSPQGDRIATCTDPGPIRVYDSRTGHLILDILVNVAANCNVCLTWSDDGQYIFTVSDGIIKQFQVSTRQAVSEWPIQNCHTCTCVSLSKRGGFIAHASSSHSVIKVLDVSRDIQLDQPIKYDAKEVRSIAFSRDDQLLAIGTEDGKITIRNLQDTPNSAPSFSGPFVHVGGAVLHSWQHGQLQETEMLLTDHINTSGNSDHCALAYRALVRARLKEWNGAKHDAETSVKIQPSVVGLIANGVALVGEKKILEAYRMCDLAFRHCDSERVDILLAVKAAVVCMAGEYVDAIARLSDLIAATHEDSIYHTIQAYMHLLYGVSLAKDKDYDGAIQSFEHAWTQMRRHTSRRLQAISLIFGWQFDDLDIMIQRNLCEALCAAGRMRQAGEMLTKIIDNPARKNGAMEFTEWISSFSLRCLSIPRCDQVSSSAVYSRRFLKEWTKTTLTGIPWKDALEAAGRFTVPRIMTYQVIIEHLEMAKLLVDAVDCFHQMMDELALTRDEEVKWIIDFKCRCAGKLEETGKADTGARRYDEAILRYSASLDLYPTGPQARLAKRSKVYIAKGLWREALRDADEIVKLDSSSALGYERRYAALWGERRYEEAEEAFQTMLLMMSESPDPGIRVCSGQYVTPRMMKAAIDDAVRVVLDKLPPVLLNSISGHLCCRSDLVSVFESHPTFTELVTSVTTEIDHARIEHTVTEYYRYATLSHTWEGDEPLFKDATHVTVYNLKESLAHDKLRKFCEIAKEAGLHWAWSDTCCINKENPVVLQEALVAMFRWYQGSTLTVIFLRGVRSPARRGDLISSVWNTRAWTLQEYHASKVVRFYTEEWAPYLDPDVPNHKESPKIISEMEEATRILARDLMTLHPGLDHIRVKLRLASTRAATRVEDKAYCLLGIFSVSLPLIYGEGERALGRLLAQLLTSSGDASILAWTGSPGDFNSCLPRDITVFEQLPTTYIPAIDMNPTVDKLRALSLNLALVVQVYDRIRDLPAPEFAGQRMKLPCIAFKLGRLARSQYVYGDIFHAQAGATFGTVQITTKEDLCRLGPLFLIHPWIDFLIHGQLVGNVKETASGDISDSLSGGPPTLSPPFASMVTQTRTGSFMTRLGGSFSNRSTTSPRNVVSLRAPSVISPMDREMRALELVSRLMQPFGALLLAQKRHGPTKYERVATESMITFRVQEMSTAVLMELLQNVCTLDVL